MHLEFSSHLAGGKRLSANFGKQCKLCRQAKADIGPAVRTRIEYNTFLPSLFCLSGWHHTRIVHLKQANSYGLCLRCFKMEFAAQYGSALFAGWKLKLQGVRACVDKGLNRGAKPTVRKNLSSTFVTSGHTLILVFRNLYRSLSVRNRCILALDRGHHTSPFISQDSTARKSGTAPATCRPKAQEQTPSAERARTPPRPHGPRIKQHQRKGRQGKDDRTHRFIPNERAVLD